MTINLTVRDTAGPNVQQVVRWLESPGFRMVAARGVRNRLQEHFQMLEDTRPNKEGWRRVHFWDQVRRSVQAPKQIGNQVAISINHIGIAQRFFGGTILPRPGHKFLTLPASEEAYGKRAGEFNDLRFDVVPDPDHGNAMRPALVRSTQTVIKKTKKGYKATKTIIGGVLYWLTRKVEQAPDPTVLPTNEQLMQAGVQAGAEWVQEKALAAQRGNQS